MSVLDMGSSRSPRRLRDRLIYALRSGTDNARFCRISDVSASMMWPSRGRCFLEEDLDPATFQRAPDYPVTPDRPKVSLEVVNNRAGRCVSGKLGENARSPAVMHASMIISGPDLVAYRRNILCAGESVGTGIPDLLPRSAGPAHEVGVTSPAFPCISKREPPGHCPAPSAGRTCPSCRWGVASQ